MKRLQWQSVAERWLADAKVLLDARSWSAAYYVAGYAVECGLKACIMARMDNEAEVIFADRRFSEKCWTHNLPDLVKLASLESARVVEITANKEFRQHWQVVKDWNEQSRYLSWSHHAAKKLYRAITEPTNGVMRWVRLHW